MRKAPGDGGLVDAERPRRAGNSARTRRVENVTQIVPVQVLHLEVLHICSLPRQICPSKGPSADDNPQRSGCASRAGATQRLAAHPMQEEDTMSAVLCRRGATTTVMFS